MSRVKYHAPHNFWQHLEGRMKQRTAIALKFILVLAILLAPPLAWIFCNGIESVGWLRSEGSIERSVLKEIPLGSNKREVLAYLERHHYRIVSMSNTAGVWSKGRQPVGSQHITAHLGGYSYGIGHTDVSVDFGFDASDVLIILDARKEHDSL